MKIIHIIVGTSKTFTGSEFDPYASMRLRYKQHSVNLPALTE